MLRFALLLALALLPTFAHADPATRPNILIIIADDQGYTDFGFMGSQLLTPHLDRLASQGTVFPNGMSTASVCAPALRTLLSGLHPQQWQHRSVQIGYGAARRRMQNALPQLETLPKLLGRAGYETFMAGKSPTRSPELAGFDDGLAKRRKPKDPDHTAGNDIGRTTMAPVLDFIDREHDRPFFMWFAPMLPHVPHDPPENFTLPYAELPISRMAINYYGNVTRFDDVVGQLLKRLDERGLARDTLVIFLADNGWDQIEGIPDPGEKPQKFPFDGPRGKNSMHELGFRTPIIVRYPDHVQAGASNAALVSLVDIYPTVLEYADIAMPEESGIERHGHGLRPLLEGRAEWKRRFVIGGMRHSRTTYQRPATRGPPTNEAYEPAFFYRDAEWRYIWRRDWDAEELYNIQRDPRETRDVLDEHPEIAARARAEIERWLRAMERTEVRVQKPAEADG